MQTIRLAVIGAGHLGRIHARLAKELAGARLVAVADPVRSAREALAAEVNTQAVEDYRELVGQIDAAIVATPTRTHHEVGTQLLARGIHCLIEKPIAATVAEADSLCQEAKRQGAVLQVGHVERFNPALPQAFPHLEEPKYISAVRTSGYAFRSTDIGVVLDLMIHDLDVTLSLVRSPVVEVRAFGVSVLGGHEDLAQARLTFASGCIADLTASRVSYKMERAMQVYTPCGFAAIDFSTRTTTIVRPSEALARGERELERLSPKEKETLKANFFREILPMEAFQAEAGNAIAEEQQDFFRSIRTGEPPRVTGQQGRDALAVAEQILEQIATHAWDGTTSGRVGPKFHPASPPLRGPHFPLAPGFSGVRSLREAG